MSTDTAVAAELLLQAQDHALTLELFSASTTLDGEEAYAIQDQLIARRVARGELVIGMKLGFTSLAKQQAMGVDQPIFGVLTDAMRLKEGEPLPVDELIHPRVEPEVVFVLKDDLRGPDVSALDVLSASASVRLGLEVIDSRYADYSFTYADVVADNTSAGRFVISERSLPPGTDLAAIAVELQRDGVVEQRATGAAVMGDPALAVALLANWLAERGRVLSAGTIVLSGGMTNAIEARKGSIIRAVFAGLDEISLTGK